MRALTKIVSSIFEQHVASYTEENDKKKIGSWLINLLVDRNLHMFFVPTVMVSMVEEIMSDTLKRDFTLSVSAKISVWMSVHEIQHERVFNTLSNSIKQVYRFSESSLMPQQLQQTLALPVKAADEIHRLFEDNFWITVIYLYQLGTIPLIEEKEI